MLDLERAVLDVVSKKNYTPVKSRKIAKRLNLGDAQAGDLKKVIKRLVKEGRLAYAAGHAVCLPAAAARHRITGTFRRMPEGYGFVRPAATLADGNRSEDVYINREDAADASSGDSVLVEISRRRGGRGGYRKHGRVVEVTDRETHRFVGTYFERAGSGLVQVDGKVFSQPILVGDAGAKGVRIDDKVVIEMVRFPSHVHDGEAVVVEVLGQRGDPGVDTLSIINEFGLPGEFPEDVLQSARQQAAVFNEAVDSDRRDLTDLAVVTIDPLDARDFDDAISLESLDGGHWRLGVHIADVSHFVPEQSPLDREARERANSVYLPDRVIPMLPEIISNNLASLQPDRVRYTRTVFLDFTAEGVRTGVESCAAAIRSDRRFTYEEVDDYLADPGRWRKKLSPRVHALLANMHRLAMLLRRRRFGRGSLELTMPEVKIDLDAEGRVAGAHLVEYTESHQIIEEFMLVANEAVAETLREANLEFLRRAHAAPDPRKLKALAEFVRELGFDADGLESRFQLQRLLHDVRGRPEEHAVNYAVLRSLQKAVYSPQDEGHYALASDCYSHFTSPIRRYPDLTVHRTLRSLLRHERPAATIDELLALGDHCSQREQRAEQAERELIKVKLLNYLSERIGEEMEGVVTGVQDFGLFVQGIQLPAEGLVHITSLADDYYHYDKASHSLTGRKRGNAFRLGDYVRVAVAHVDVDRRVLDFRLTGRLKDRPADPPTKKRKPAARSAPKRKRSGIKKKKGRKRPK